MFIFRLIANNLAALTLLGAIAAYLYPPVFLIFRDYFLWFFAATMCALGIVLEPQNLNKQSRNPAKSAWVCSHNTR